MTGNTLSALLVATALAAGCSQGGVQVQARVAAAGAHPGGNIRVGVTSPGSLDPSDAYEPAGQLVISTICEPLLQFDPLTAKLEAGIAKSWIVTGNGTTVTLTLRDGVRLQGGGTLSTSDVIAELSRVASADNASEVADLLQDVAGYDVIHGDVESDDALALRQLSGLSGISGTGFSLKLAAGRHNGDIVNLFGHPITAPVPHAAATLNTFVDEPRCAGPYELTSPWKSGNATISVRRFADYYGANPAYPAGGRGYADTLTFVVTHDRREQLHAFAAGQLDIAQISDEDRAAAELLATSTKSTLVDGPNGAMEYVGFPRAPAAGKATVFDSAVVHRALSLALDRDALNRVVYGGGARPATGFIPPTVAEAYRPNACANAPAHGDLTSATNSLRAAGIDLSGQALKLYYNDNPQNAAIARQVAHQWRLGLGVNVTTVGVPWSVYVARATGSDGFDGAFLEGWQAPYPSADGYLAPLFTTAGRGTANFTQYSNPNVDRLLNTSARWADETNSRILDYTFLQKLICQDMPMAPLVFRQSHYLVRTSRVGSAIGSFVNAATGLPELREVYVK
jgi:oligopeptide transport system substrate-binding protein